MSHSSAEIQISIVTYNNEASIRNCLDSIIAEVAGRQEAIWVWDNDSSDATAEVISHSYPEVNLIRSGANIGFGPGHNRLLEQIQSPFLLIINPDTVLMPGSLSVLTGALSNDAGAALAGPKVIYSDGSPQASWGSFPTNGFDAEHRARVTGAQQRERAVVRRLNKELARPIYPDWLSGVCLLARREAMERVNGFDEGFFLYMEDVDLCRRLRETGQRVILHPEAVCQHIEGGSNAPSRQVKAAFRRSKLRYLNKYCGFWQYCVYALIRYPKGLFGYDKGLRQGAGA